MNSSAENDIEAWEGEGGAAPYPERRNAFLAEACAQEILRAEILSWSRSRGVFAGISLQGATLRQDLDDNATLYGKKLKNREIVMQGIHPPEAASKLLSLLNQYSAREK